MERFERVIQLLGMCQRAEDVTTSELRDAMMANFPFAAYLALTLARHPLFPFDMGSLEWSNAWLLTPTSVRRNAKPVGALTTSSPCGSTSGSTFGQPSPTSPR